MKKKRKRCNRSKARFKKRRRQLRCAVNSTICQRKNDPEWYCSVNKAYYCRVHYHSNDYNDVEHCCTWRAEPHCDKCSEKWDYVCKYGGRYCLAHAHGLAGDFGDIAPCCSYGVSQDPYDSGVWGSSDIESSFAGSHVPRSYGLDDKPPVKERLKFVSVPEEEEDDKGCRKKRANDRRL